MQTLYKARARSARGHSRTRTAVENGGEQKASGDTKGGVVGGLSQAAIGFDRYLQEVPTAVGHGVHG